MIVKYLNDGVWGYIDNVRQTKCKDLEVTKLIESYNSEVANGSRKDTASFFDDVEITKETASANKLFLKATEDQSEWGHCVHTENLLNGEMVEENYPASVVILYIDEKEHSEFDTTALVTNQKCYLMNDKGQTIERLV